MGPVTTHVPDTNSVRDLFDTILGTSDLGVETGPFVTQNLMSTLVLPKTSTSFGH